MRIWHHTRWRTVALLVTIVSASCASQPPSPPGTGTLFGTVDVVPRSDLPLRKAGGGAYADRALRDVTFVDYTRVGFAVVYTESETPPVLDAVITMRQPGHALRLEPTTATATTRGTILLANETDETRLVSDAYAGVLRRVAPGETIRIATPRPGLHRIKLLGETTSAAEVYVTPGPHARVSDRGRYELAGISPGPTTLHTWHARFAPAASSVHVEADERLRVDIALGVEASPEGSIGD